MIRVQRLGEHVNHILWRGDKQQNEKGLAEVFHKSGGSLSQYVCFVHGMRNWW